MKSRKNLALLWIFSALPAVALLFLYGRLPEQVPTNFGFDGTVNAYSPRSTMWLLALLGPFMALMFQILPQIDPKRRNYAKFQKYYDLLRILGKYTESQDQKILAFLVRTTGFEPAAYRVGVIRPPKKKPRFHAAFGYIPQN